MSFVTRPAATLIGGKGRQKLLRVLPLITALLWIPFSAPASALPACSLFSGYTLSDMIGQGCIVGDKYFYDFASSSPDSLLQSIDFNPLAPISNDPGFQLSGFAAPPGQTVSFNLTYTVQVSPGQHFAIRTPEIAFTGITLGSVGNLSGAALYCENGGPAEACAAGGMLYSLAITPPPLATTFSAGLNIPAIINLDVGLDLVLKGGQQTSGTGIIAQRFGQVATPEPAAFLLLGSGLVAIARMSPRRRGD